MGCMVSILARRVNRLGGICDELRRKNYPTSHFVNGKSRIVRLLPYDGLVRSDLSVTDVDAPVCVLRNVVFMCHENDSVPLLVEILKKRLDFLSRFLIQFP